MVLRKERKNITMEKRNLNLKEVVTDLINDIGPSIKKDSLNEETVKKFDGMLSLISMNIKLTKDLKNFDTTEYRIDKTKVFNMKMKYTSSGNLLREDIEYLNKYFQKHKRISKSIIK